MSIDMRNKDSSKQDEKDRTSLSPLYIETGVS